MKKIIGSCLLLVLPLATIAVENDLTGGGAQVARFSDALRIHQDPH